MAIRTILTREDPILSKKCHAVTKFDEKLWELLEDMKETLSKSNGVGLAAPQIGIVRRVVIVVNDEGEMLELINPEIIETSGEQDGLEGCLSVPGYYGFVERPMYVKVRCQNRHGEWVEYEGEELTARCFCHELDHLDGHLYTELADELYTPEELERMEDEE